MYPTLPEHIGSSVEHDTVCWVPIPPCSSTLLVIVLHWLADTVVSHEANIRLVDTHTKGNSSYNNLQKNHEKKKTTFNFTTGKICKQPGVCCSAIACVLCSCHWKRGRHGSSQPWYPAGKDPEWPAHNPYEKNSRRFLAKKQQIIPLHILQQIWHVLCHVQNMTVQNGSKLVP